MHFEGFACASQRLIPLLNAQPTGEEAEPGQNRTLLSVGRTSDRGDPPDQAPLILLRKYSACGLAHSADPWVGSCGACVTRRRLDDRIRELCDKALAARSADELDTILADLQSAFREHNNRLRKKVRLSTRKPRRRFVRGKTSFVAFIA
jgi:hypothetical protein